MAQVVACRYLDPSRKSLNFTKDNNFSSETLLNPVSSVI
jgi:hypothetical protein